FSGQVISGVKNMDSGTKTFSEEASTWEAQEMIGTVSKVETPQAEIAVDVALPVLVIEPRPGWYLVNLRELLFFLTWRDIKVRYKQTVLGAAWAILQPLATMMVFTFFLGRVAAAADS